MAINVDISVRNMEVTDRINDYVTRKVSKLDKFLTGIEEARVDLAFAKSARSQADRQVAQITIRGKGYILRTEERADDIFTAIDAAVEKMQRQIERYKGKHYRGRGDGTSLAKTPSEPVEVEETSLETLIARRKNFTLIPMDEAEAIEQMSLLGHENFFVFFNANSQKINILYRRRDGSLGLIEPEVG